MGDKREEIAQNWVDSFVKSYEKAKTGKSKLKTEIYVSPTKLAERRFYWVAETEDGDTIEIDIPLPKLVIADIFSFLFLGAYQSLFEGEVVEALPDSDSAELELAKEMKKIADKKKGIILLEYMFYILWHQDEDDVRQLINRCSTKGEWNKIFEEIKHDVVHSYVVDALSLLGLEYADALTNLIPFALDLYLYVNSLRTPKIRKIDEESVEERAQQLARWL